MLSVVAHWTGLPGTNALAYLYGSSATEKKSFITLYPGLATMTIGIPPLGKTSLSQTRAVTRDQFYKPFFFCNLRCS